MRRRMSANVRIRRSDWAVRSLEFRNELPK